VTEPVSLDVCRSVEFGADNAGFGAARPCNVPASCHRQAPHEALEGGGSYEEGVQEACSVGTRRCDEPCWDTSLLLHGSVELTATRPPSVTTDGGAGMTDQSGQSCRVLLALVKQGQQRSLVDETRCWSWTLWTVIFLIPKLNTRVRFPSSALMAFKQVRRAVSRLRGQPFWLYRRSAGSPRLIRSYKLGAWGIGRIC
jgi:hypothetical protein